MLKNFLFLALTALLLATPSYGQTNSYACDGWVSEFPELDKHKVNFDRPFILVTDDKTLKFTNRLGKDTKAKFLGTYNPIISTYIAEYGSKREIQLYYFKYKSRDSNKLLTTKSVKLKQIAFIPSQNAVTTCYFQKT